MATMNIGTVKMAATMGQSKNGHDRIKAYVEVEGEIVRSWIVLGNDKDKPFRDGMTYREWLLAELGVTDTKAAAAALKGRPVIVETKEIPVIDELTEKEILVPTHNIEEILEA